MEKKIKKLRLRPWTVATCVLAVLLAFNLCQSLAGRAVFAWWHLPTLAFCAALAWEDCTSQERRLITVSFYRLKRVLAHHSKKTVKTFSGIIRAVRCLPALLATAYRIYRTEYQNEKKGIY